MYPPTPERLQCLQMPFGVDGDFEIGRPRIKGLALYDTIQCFIVLLFRNSKMIPGVFGPLGPYALVEGA